MEVCGFGYSQVVEITPILLAAGASSRMGRPKPLLDFDGRTCLEIALDAVGGLGRPIVVLGPSREEILGRVDLSSSTIAINDQVESGQTASLKAALARLPAGAAAFLFYLVDFPLVWRPEVEALVRAFGGPGKDILIPSHAMRRGHPVLCRRALAEELLALPDGAPARTVINALPERLAYVEFPGAYILMDMDTPEDYAGCLEAYRARVRREKR